MNAPQTCGRGRLPRLAKTRAFEVGLSMICVLLSGCGYTLVGASPSTGNQKTIMLAIPPVINLTQEPDLERRMTSALRHAIVETPTLKLVLEPQASYTLEGVANQFLAFATSFDSSDRVVQFRIESRMRIRLTERQTDRAILEQDIDAWTEYLVSPSGSMRENAAARAAALVRVSRQFAEKCRALVEITLM